jgi:hypothetical protein
MNCEFLTRSSTMRYPLVFFSISLALLLLVSDAVMAQTTTAASTALTALSERALRRQDREDCTKQATQHNIGRRDLAYFVRRCMAVRQASRKRPGNIRMWTRRQWNMVVAKWSQEKSKWADCRKQAGEQKLTGRKSWPFLYRCMTS